MAFHFDLNRGNNANNGSTPALAKKTLDQITTLSVSGGADILLADDSFWETAATRILINSGLGWSSTLASPLRIAAYSPLSVTQGKPTIDPSIFIPAGSWSWNAGQNAWQYSAAFTLGQGCYLKLGVNADKTGGDWAIRTDVGLPLSSTPKLWHNSGSTLFLWAPSNVNPVDYYGSILFAPDNSQAVFLISSPGSLAAIDIDGIDFVRTGGGIHVYNSTGTRSYRISNIGGEEVGGLIYSFTETAGAVSLDISEVTARKTSTYVIGGYTNAGVGTASWDVHHCNLADGNYGYPQGLIYSQVRGGLSRIYFNEIKDARYGVPGKQSDGCAIYTETGADQTLVFGNIVRNCHNAFQDNSGRGTYWSGNVTINCHTPMKITDANSNGATNLRYWNNTNLGCGAPVPAASGPGVSGIGVWSGTNGFVLDIVNNLMTVHESPVSVQPAFELPVTATGRIQRNLSYGFSTEAQAFDGQASPVTPAEGLFASPAAWLDSYRMRPTVDIGGIPMRNPLDGAGLFVQGARTFDGAMLDPGRVPIGACRPPVRMR